MERTIDRVVWYAGWADKLPQVLGGSNPVAGPYFNFTVPEPTGVVAIVAPEEPPLEGLVSRIAPAIVGGNCVVAVASESAPLASLELAETLATSDLPGGVVNLLTGFRAELAPVLAAHMDVNAIDLTGVDEGSAELESLAAENVKRVVRAHGRAEPVGDLRVSRAEDGLASRRHLAAHARDPPGRGVRGVTPAPFAAEVDRLGRRGLAARRGRRRQEEFVVNQHKLRAAAAAGGSVRADPSKRHCVGSTQSLRRVGSSPGVVAMGRCRL